MTRHEFAMLLPPQAEALEAMFYDQNPSVLWDDWLAGAWQNLNNLVVVVLVPTPSPVGEHPETLISIDGSLW